MKLFSGGDVGAVSRDAVEEYDVILLCISEQYRDSDSCRSGNNACD